MILLFLQFINLVYNKKYWTKRGIVIGILEIAIKHGPPMFNSHKGSAHTTCVETTCVGASSNPMRRFHVTYTNMMLSKSQREALWTQREALQTQREPVEYSLHGVRKGWVCIVYPVFQWNMDECLDEVQNLGKQWAQSSWGKM